jgi:hypothetical protein
VLRDDMWVVLPDTTLGVLMATVSLSVMLIVSG